MWHFDSLQNHGQSHYREITFPSKETLLKTSRRYTDLDSNLVGKMTSNLNFTDYKDY